MKDPLARFWRNVAVGMAIFGFIFILIRVPEARAALKEAIGKAGKRLGTLDSPPPEKMINVIIFDPEGKPVADINVALRHKSLILDQNLTDSQAGRAMLSIHSVEEGSFGEIVLNPINLEDPKVEQKYNYSLLLAPKNYEQEFCFIYHEDDDKSFSMLENCGNTEPTVDVPVITVPTREPRAKLPNAFIDKFEGQTSLWKTGKVEGAYAEYIVGLVAVENGFLKLTYVNLKGYWTHNVDVPTNWSAKDFAYEVDFTASNLPEVDHSRFHNKLRVMPNGSHYSVVISSNGEVNIFFTDANDQVINLDRFQSNDYVPAEGAPNKLTIKLKDNVFDIRINGGETVTYIDELRLINEPGRFRIAVDGPANNTQSYSLDRIVIKEWTDEQESN